MFRFLSNSSPADTLLDEVTVVVVVFDKPVEVTGRPQLVVEV